VLCTITTFPLAAVTLEPPTIATVAVFELAEALTSVLVTPKKVIAVDNPKSAIPTVAEADPS